MSILFGLLLFGLILASLVLPWVHITRIQALRKEIDRLTAQVSWLISYAREKGEKPPEQWEKLESLLKEKREKEPTKTIPIPPLVISKPEISTKKVEESFLNKRFSLKDLKESFEQKFVVSLPVWIGGIALALAGAFMVKYSIEMGFLSPSVRVIIGSLFGISLLFFGNWIYDRPHIANGKRIAQALSGAGIADLYVCLFAATSFYHLIPSLMGFIGMAVVTMIAVVLSLKQGPPIAMLGMIGGFLTPALIESREPNAQFLFVYLYFVLAGLFTVIRKKNWWFMSIPIVLAAFAWVFFWLETSYSPHDSLWLGLFLIAMSATIVFHSKKAMEEHIIGKPESFQLFSVLNYLSMGGAVLLMSVVAAKSNFGEMEWGLFGFLAAGGIVLSYYNQAIYGFIPWVSIIMNFLMLLAWKESDPTVLGSTILSFALLYTVSSYWLMWRALKPLSWAMLGAISSLTFYVLAYAKFHNWVGGGFPISQTWYTEAHFWGMLALGLFFLSLVVIIQILNRFEGEEGTKQRLLTVFILTATAFLSIGLTLELNKEFLTIALAAEVLVVSWINRYTQIQVLRPLAGGFAILFGILIVPQLLFQISLLSNGFTNVMLNPSDNVLVISIFEYLQRSIPSVNWSLFHLGLPALMFGTSSLYLRQQKDDSLVGAFEITTIGLITVMTYYLMRHAFHIHEHLLFALSTFIERGAITNVFFLYGLACLWLGKNFKREAISLSGKVLIAFALFRIIFFDLLLYNPLVSHQYVGSFPLFNALLLSFGLPMLWLMFAHNQFTKTEAQKYSHYINMCLFVLLFLFINFNVRQLYHGSYLDVGITSNAEAYTYSAAWLLTGIGLLFFGTLQHNKTLRIASLVFMMLTVGKVFLYDASELTGLLRIFSFLGLGISLLGLSWFYTRFVFKRAK